MFPHIYNLCIAVDMVLFGGGRGHKVYEIGPRGVPFCFSFFPLGKSAEAKSSGGDKQTDLPDQKRVTMLCFTRHSKYRSAA